MTTTQQFRLQRPGDIDLVFDGVLLAEESSKDDDDQEFWTEVRIYRTAKGNYVAETVGRARFGDDRPTIRVAQEASGLRDALKRSDPKAGTVYMTNLAVDALHEAGRNDPDVQAVLTEEV